MNGASSSIPKKLNEAEYASMKFAFAEEIETFNVTDFGALGDGLTMDTEALQAALDSCHNAGGGTVVLPKGRYLTAALRLRSNTNFHLEKGSVLLGSTDPNDYPEWEAKNFHAHLAPYNARYLLGAEGEENISLTGEGTIDGQGFSHYDCSDLDARLWPINDKNTRPGRMIFFALCRNVRIEGITCLASPAWTFWMAGCDKVVFHNVTIDTDWRQINTDGIDIDNCRNVTITHCNIRTGDDAIVLRAIDRVFMEKRVCEQVRITNCTLSSNYNAIRLSYLRDGIIRNVTAENITIEKSRRGIICQVPTCQETPEKIDPAPDAEGPIVENIRFSNIRIQAVRPIWFRLSEHAPARHIGNIRFENIDLIGTTASLIEGNSKNKMTNFSLENIRIKMTDGVLLPGAIDQREMALGLICRHCDNLTIRNIVAEGNNAKADASAPLFHFEHVAGLSFSGIGNRTGHSDMLTR